MEQLFQWDERQLVVGELPTSYLEIPWDKNSLEYLKTNPTRHLLMLWKYIHHIDIDAQVSSISGDAFFILLPENFYKITWKDFMTWRLNDSTMSHSYVSSTGHREQPKPDPNQNAQLLLNFKKSIKREVSQYTILKMRNILKPSKGIFWLLPQHIVVPVNDADSQELFQQKQYSMYSVFYKVLQSDMGKTIVRKHAPALDAQSVWSES